MLKEDEEFRYAVAGLIGMEEILRRLDRNEQEVRRIWQEIEKLREDMMRGFERHDREIEDVARKYASEALRDPNSLVLVCEEGGRVVGFLKADVVDRLFYEPRREGVIREFYLLPEFRRRGVGRTMIEKAFEELRSMGAGIITAEFPSQHKIAVSFYENLGFRPIISKYAKEVTR